MSSVEVQIDRLVGPTHHFGGLGVGNVASRDHAGQLSNPRAAALQGLDKMALVSRLGVPQFILPPQRRPRLDWLRRCGLTGSDCDVLRRAHEEAPQLLSAATSCSAMWTANAATVAPSSDTRDGSLNLTIANLDASLHRWIEPEDTLSELRLCVPNEAKVHPEVPGGTMMRDEGAANHMRLSAAVTGSGLHVFVFGDGHPTPKQYFARQTRAACLAVARLNQLPLEGVILLKQNSNAIDAGAFHNDVVALSHRDLVVCHEAAYHNSEESLSALGDRFESLFRKPLRIVVVGSQQLTLADSIRTYLFNSQVIDSPHEDAPPIMICPKEVREHPQANELVEGWRDREAMFSEVRSVELRQSMAGGGGPACLRLRVPVPADQIEAFNPAMKWTEKLDREIREVIERDYPTSITLNDLSRIDLVRELEAAGERVRAMLLPT